VTQIFPIIFVFLLLLLCGVWHGDVVVKALDSCLLLRLRLGFADRCARL